MPRLFCQAGKDIGQDFPIQDDMILGRKSDCAIIVDDEKASRAHAKIVKGEGEYYLEDLNSSNGTYLNDIKIDKRRLNFGDKIRIGRTVLVFLADPDQNLEGQTLAGFKIEKNLGARGIGLVYRAKQTKLARDVALKVLDKDYAADESFVKRFISEARAAGKLRHRGVIQVFDVGHEDGSYYACMEYISGKTLRDTISAEGTLPVQRVKEISLTVAEAMKEAHDNDIVHGELNPANIILTEDMEPKIAELGIPKTPDPARKDVYALKYLSPEEAIGAGTTKQSDIYSLGICIYEMLAGEPPFEAETTDELIEMHKRDALPDLSETWPEVPKTLALIIKKMCLKNLSNRYTTMQEVLDDLRKAPTEVKGGKSRRRRVVSANKPQAVRQASKPASSRPAAQRSPGNGQAWIAAMKPEPEAANTPVEQEITAARAERRINRFQRLSQTRAAVEVVVGASLLIVLFLLSYLVVYFVLSIANKG